MKTHVLNQALIKAIQLELLQEIDAFCQAAGIHYSLAYGTLIGAVRHQGFIPWDDDIDLIMPRPDFDRFLQTFHSEKDEVIDLSRSNVCVETFAKVCRKNTIMTDCNTAIINESCFANIVIHD